MTVRVVREGLPPAVLRLAGGTRLAAVRDAAAEGMPQPAETYMLAAPGGAGGTSAAWAAAGAGGPAWADVALAAAAPGSGGVTLHLLPSARRGEQARGTLNARQQHYNARHDDMFDDEEGDDDDNDDDDDEDVMGMVPPGGELTYEQAMAIQDRLGRVAVGADVAAVAALRTAPAPRRGDLASRGETAERCAICLADLAAEDPPAADVALTQLPCGHCLHAPCAKDWLAMASWCPLCRQPVQRR